ncbi:S9 family peptidase [Pedobacter sp. MC2016-24]|uniref:alpha/beta hydrolase family protein n=1 Tax=Pedobacter sp. MC2016-24 TaxID=2780090 RepID=UPI00187EDC65|nr:alpha/beta fold hydrolase [Pedobacter sp. MC2016-24]MBE9600204.1 alpha/beta fold hydrolase [Pedobacter sp. MC2016-24]
MMKTHNPVAAILCTLILSVSSICSAQIKGTIWDVRDIYQIPPYQTLSADSALEIIYQGLKYKGRPQNVYAYYASPGTLKGDRAKDKNLPAVVLVHGGGGTAFKKWAIMWAKKGYAAIAMDLRGNDGTKKHIAGGFDEPDGQTPYFTITPGLNEQWMYQAVADVILAHNLIRSFKEVDPKRTALTGISWGGIITCLLAGIDDRYQAAVPVYGCGYLFENSEMRKSLDLLNAADRNTWVTQYDPSEYLAKAKMPMLFINGTNDGHFFLNSYAKTYNLVKNRNLSVKIGLKNN